LRRAADIWLANAAEIERWSIREGGKVPPAAQFETHVATGEIYEAATLPSRPYGELIPSEQPRLSFAERVPAGVVGVIAPFNFPQILAIRSVAPALALGNAVVLKPDPAQTAARMRAIAAALTAAGLDARVHDTRGVLDITASLHRPVHKDIDVTVDEDHYVEIRYWNNPDATPAQVTAVITRALTAITRPS